MGGIRERGNLVFTSAESLRAFAPGPVSSWSSTLGTESVRPESVGVSTSWYDRAACACCSWIDCAKACGSATATALSSWSALKSRLLFSRCSCSSEMAERRAIASGFSLSDIATAGGWGMNVALGGGGGCVGCGGSRGGGGGGTMRACPSVQSTGASWAAVTVGVMGDTGGRFGEAD